MAIIEQGTVPNSGGLPAPQPVPVRPVPELRIYTHSSLLYWWPTWVVGYIMALLTYLEGAPHGVGGAEELYHPSSNLALLYFLTLFFVVLVTNFTLRGLASGLVVMGAVLVTVVLAYYDLWPTVLRWAGDLSLHMNLGCYLFFSTLMFIAWFLTVFIFDHMSYWRITPGQVTQVRLFGAGARSYETDNMILEKYRNDLFRHWLLGLGAGDIRVRSGGTRPEELSLPNVLFVGHKVALFQRMMAERPDQFSRSVVH